MTLVKSLLFRTPLRYKVLSIALVTLLGFATYFAINLVLVHRNELRLDDIASTNYPVLERANDNLQALEKITETLNLAVITSEMDMLAKADGIHTNIHTNLDEMGKLQPEYMEYYANVHSALHEYFDVARNFSAGMIQHTVNMDELPKYSGIMTEKLETVRNTFEGFRVSMHSLFLHNLQEAKIAEMRALEYGGFIGILVTFIIVAVAFFVVRLISNDILNVANSLKDLADGDSDLSLRVTAHSRDEIGLLVNNLNAFLDKMRAIMQTLTTTVRALGDITVKISHIAENVDRSVGAQQSEITQVATAITQMATTIHAVAEHATETSSAAQTTNHLAENGQQTVNRAVESMSRLATDVDHVSDTIENLAQQTERIGSVLDTIQGISEQTNLLALNAAIEAARAGEQGRGFAVVADEVRTLATRTQSATKEIQTMIEQLQSGAYGAVTAIHSGREQTKVSLEQADAAGRALNEIAQAVANINTMNLQVAAATEQQSAVAQGIEDKTISISELANKTREHTRAAADTSDGLIAVSKELQLAVGRYKI
ncbi:MAG: methyl-accepting chemotaxis protein [Gammaproteobacteria bacterium]|nr:methyl-accepting chemotaxis protein [Gammaproteobacteria bacterium]